MSYGRDPDRHTRGAGAIASRDNVNPAATHARRRARNQQTVAHDRAVRQMTFGPRGGIGAVDLGMKGGPKGGISTTTGRGISFDYGTSNQPGIPEASGGVPRPPVSPTTPTSRGQLARPGRFTTALQQLLEPLRPPSTVPPPPPLPPPSTRPQPSPVITRPSSSSGGGGGGGVWQPTTKPTTTVEIPEEVVVPDVPESAATAISGKTVAILGAAAVAAYFLLRKKGA